MCFETEEERNSKWRHIENPYSFTFTWLPVISLTIFFIVVYLIFQLPKP